MWFIFRRSRKMNHIPLFCERSERKGRESLWSYAHPSIINYRTIVCKMRE
ncbi:MAG: hypothetical protein U5L45_23425 [Saprospiraceae bacterium]|nr:hypothetical protein [Saprospiraceae bacterium]